MDSVPLLLFGSLLPVVFLQVYGALFARATMAFVPLGRSAQKPVIIGLTERRIFGEEGSISAFDMSRLALPLRTDYGAYGGRVKREAPAVCLIYKRLDPAMYKDEPFLQQVGERCQHEG